MNATAPATYVARPEVKGKALVVLVHRSDRPTSTWGVHELTQREATKADRMDKHDHAYLALTNLRAPRWNNHVVGLFSAKPELIVQGFNRLTAESIVLAGARKPVGAVLMMTNEFNSVMDFIGREVIPLEWQQGWKDDNPEIRSRVEVWV